MRARSAISPLCHPRQLLAGANNNKRALNLAHQLTGAKPHLANLPKEAPILKLIDGEFVPMLIPHRDRTHNSHWPALPLADDSAARNL